MFDFLYKERLISEYVPLVGHVGANGQAVLLTDASVHAMYEVTGYPWETSSDESLRHSRLNDTLKGIAGDTIIISVYQCRGVSDRSVYPEGTFNTPFARNLDSTYRNRLFDQTLYRNRTFIGITIRPPRYAGEFLGEQMSRRGKPADEAPEDRILRLEDVCAILASELSIYAPTRLGIAERNGMLFSEIAEALLLAVTGVYRPVGLTTGALLEHRHEVSGVNVLGNAMFSEQIIIGREVIEFRMPGRSWFGAMFGMRHYPARTYPGMFGRLLAAPYRCTAFNSFRFIATQDAQWIMKKKGSRMVAGNDPARSQIAELEQAADQLASTGWVMGDHSFALLAFADSVKAMTDVATAAWSDLAESGMIVAREHAALEAALFQILPGNARLRPRAGFISSRNMASMAPLHGYPAGAERGYWGGPVALFRTAAGTPYRFHLHVGDVGNTFICGRVGSGKSTWIAFIIAQAERLGAQVVLWDKDRGLCILVHALHGSYLELKNPTGLAPLKALTASDEDVTFLSALLQGVITASDKTPLSPDEESRRLRLALEMVMSMPPEKRWLKEVVAYLGVNPNGAGARLERWCHGKELGWVIDCEKDEVSLTSRVIGFDQTFILDNPFARGPVMATLFHYVDKLIDGRKLLFVIDEFWKSLLDDAFRGLVNNKLRTLRKLNSPMILATQSPRDAIRSDISHTLRDQCPSQIYFSNGSEPSWDDLGDKGMGLTQAEFNIVKHLPEGSGEFLLRQGRHSVRAHLPLRGMDDELAVLSGREANTKIFTRILNETRDLEEALRLFHVARKQENAQ